MTMDSILGQTCTDFEVIIKDGGSTDGSVDPWENAAGNAGDAAVKGIVRFFQEKDTGIYDAMNQAVLKTSGEFVLFLNCGDTFADKKVLERTAERIAAEQAVGTAMDRLVLYGDTLSEKNDVTITSAPRITGFTCYRNIPCHQSCFYSAALCKEKPYDLQYRIRADYDHFFWCFYQAKARFVHMGFSVASYEGGGYSESKENRDRDRREHQKITENYMSKAELFRYRAAMACTLAPLRRWVAESRVFSGAYHWVKERIYQRKWWILAAFLLFVAEFFLLIWPVRWLGEEKTNLLFGDDSWVLEAQGETAGYCQEFTPEYHNVRSIGIVITTGYKPLGDGEMSVVITDSSDEVLFHTEIPYEQLTLDSYEDVDVNLLLHPGHIYYLSVNFMADESGVVPALRVCGTEYQVPENRSLIWKETVANTQLLTRYVYEDAISTKTLFRALLLISMTAFGVLVGLPQNKIFRRLLGVILLAAGPYIIGQRLEMITVNMAYYLPFSMAWNVGLMYLLELIILFCTQSVRVSVCVSNILLTLIYSANYYVFTFRGEPLRMNDLTAIGTVVTVLDRYDLRPNSHLAMAWCLTILFIVYGLQVRVKRAKQSVKWKRILVGRLVSLTVGIIITVSVGRVLLYTDYLKEYGFMDTRGFDQNMNYHFDGYLVASMIDIQASRIVRPTGYSIDVIERLFKEAESDSQTASDTESVLPHVILIMNESFSDLRVLGKLQISEENLPFFYSLEENTVRGYVNASVLGGGTANSEFEVFTGSSMGFLPAGYYAYQQCMVKPIPSLISDMKNLGYSTYSVHPQPSSNWNRDRVYEFLGFDYSLWESDFSDGTVIHAGISDLDTYKKVEELFENREEGERLFIFDLTMQNHGGYAEVDVETTVTPVNVSSSEADLYLSLIQESDKAFEQLITYFEKQKEPVVICMYGDHQPMINPSSFYEEIFSQTEGLTDRDKTMNKYKTPFIIWANYDIQEQKELDIGMSYLGAVLLDIAGIPSSPYFTFLQQYMQEYPIITINGYLDSQGNYYGWSGDNSELPEYRILQYNHLFDNNIVSWGF